MLTKDMDDNEEITESLLDELERELIKPNWARGKTLWYKYTTNDQPSLVEFLSENFGYSFSDENRSIDCWTDPFSKTTRYIRYKDGIVIVERHSEFSELLTDPDFEFEQLKGKYETK